MTRNPEDRCVCVINIAGEPILYLKATNVDFQPVKFAQYKRTKEFYPAVYEYSSRLAFSKIILFKYVI